MATYFQGTVATLKSCDMRRIYAIFILALPLLSNGQTTLSFRTGVASYAMADLKSLQQSQLSTVQVPAKIMSSFPSYYYFGLGLDNISRNLLSGLQLNFGSTGGRIYYSDYSGTFGSDQRLSYTSLSGVIGYFSGTPVSKFRIGVNLNLGVLMFTNATASYLNVNNYPSNYYVSSSSKGFNLFIQPNVSLQYSLGPFMFGTSAGYNVNAVNSNVYGGGMTAPYKADFSGLRANASVGIVVGKDKSEGSQERSDISAGFGFGLDYGGIGASLLIYPIENVGVFTGVGYAIAGTGVNGGLKFRFNSNNASRKFFATAMYGYNTAVYVSNQTSLNRLFYGPSIGVGMDRSGKNGNTIYSFQLIVPFRGDEESNYINSLKASGVTFSNFLSPVLISFGRRIKIS
jgi:hypothetical protein